MKRLFTFIICVFFNQELYAQREVQYAQYLANPLAINPAQAGAREVFHLNAIFRKQWVSGIQSLPTSQTFAMDGRLGDKSAEGYADRVGFVGLGLQGLLDRTGLTNNTAVSGNIAYHYKIADNQTISFGVSGGINVLPIYDPTTRVSLNRAKGSVGVGINFDTESFWAGVSVPEILNQSYGGAANLGILQYSKPVFAQVGIKLVPEEDILIKPSILVSYNKGRPLGYDINLQASYQQKLGAALSYRQSTLTAFQKTNYFYGLLTYSIVPNIQVGYSYSSKVAEAYLNDRGIHELMFTFIPNPKN